MRYGICIIIITYIYIYNLKFIVIKLGIKDINTYFNYKNQIKKIMGIRGNIYICILVLQWVLIL